MKRFLAFALIRLTSSHGGLLAERYRKLGGQINILLNPRWSIIVTAWPI